METGRGIMLLAVAKEYHRLKKVLPDAAGISFEGEIEIYFTNNFKNEIIRVDIDEETSNINKEEKE